jgi:hypothetical protein
MKGSWCGRAAKGRHTPHNAASAPLRWIRPELETDLISAQVLTFETAPPAPILGSAGSWRRRRLMHNSSRIGACETVIV